MRAEAPNQPGPGVCDVVNDITGDIAVDVLIALAINHLHGVRAAHRHIPSGITDDEALRRKLTSPGYGDRIADVVAGEVVTEIVEIMNGGAGVIRRAKAAVYILPAAIDLQPLNDEVGIGIEFENTASG